MNEFMKDFVEENSTLLVVPSMYEHGPLIWMIQKGTQATTKIGPNNTVDYPWHAWLSSAFGEFEIPISPALPEDEQMMSGSRARSYFHWSDENG